MLGNIGDPEAVDAMSRAIAAELGDVDILVNCAGGDIGAAGGKPEPNNALESRSRTSRPRRRTT